MIDCHHCGAASFSFSAKFIVEAKYMLDLQAREGRERVGQSDALEKKTIYFVTVFYIILLIQQFPGNT